jgi:hypothetical protein
VNEMTQIYILHVLCIQKLRSQLLQIYSLLSRLLDTHHAKRNGSISVRCINIIHHISPCCRASRYDELKHLIGSELLMQLDDQVISLFKRTSKSSLGVVSYFLLSIPVMFGFNTKYLQFALLDLTLPVTFFLFLLVNYFLWTYSMPTLAVLYGLLFLGYVITFIRNHQVQWSHPSPKSLSTSSSTPGATENGHPVNKKRSWLLSSRSRVVLRKRHLPPLHVSLYHHVKSLFVQQKKKETMNWMNQNRPDHLQGRVLPDDDHGLFSYPSFSTVGQRQPNPNLPEELRQLQRRGLTSANSFYDGSHQLRSPQSQQNQRELFAQRGAQEVSASTILTEQTVRTVNTGAYSQSAVMSLLGTDKSERGAVMAPNDSFSKPHRAFDRPLSLPRSSSAQVCIAIPLSNHSSDNNLKAKACVFKAEPVLRKHISFVSSDMNVILVRASKMFYLISSENETRNELADVRQLALLLNWLLSTYQPFGVCMTQTQLDTLVTDFLNYVEKNSEQFPEKKMDCDQFCFWLRETLYSLTKEHQENGMLFEEGSVTSRNRTTRSASTTRSLRSAIPRPAKSGAKTMMSLTKYENTLRSGGSGSGSLRPQRKGKMVQRSSGFYSWVDTIRSFGSLLLDGSVDEESLDDLEEEVEEASRLDEFYNLPEEPREEKDDGDDEEADEDEEENLELNSFDDVLRMSRGKYDSDNELVEFHLQTETESTVATNGAVAMSPKKPAYLRKKPAKVSYLDSIANFFSSILDFLFGCFSSFSRDSSSSSPPQIQPNRVENVLDFTGILPLESPVAANLPRPGMAIGRSLRAQESIRSQQLDDDQDDGSNTSRSVSSSRRPRKSVEDREMVLQSQSFRSLNSLKQPTNPTTTSGTTESSVSSQSSRMSRMAEKKKSKLNLVPLKKIDHESVHNKAENRDPPPRVISTVDLNDWRDDDWEEGEGEGDWGVEERDEEGELEVYPPPHLSCLFGNEEVEICRI